MMIRWEGTPPLEGKARIRRLSAALAMLLAWSSPLPAQEIPSEVGIPFITNYDFRDYGGHPQNWAVAQDSRGLMYFGNTDGVLEFDGASWRLVPVSNTSIVRSLAVDSAGTVYVGAVGELGYLRPGDTGQLVYQSLVDKMPEAEREFSDVWRTFATDEGIFFWSYAGLFRWHQNRFQSWQIESHWVPGVVAGKLFYNTKDTGLKVFEGDAFIPVPGTEDLAEFRLNVMLDAGDDVMLLGTREGQLFKLSMTDSSAPDPAALSRPRRLEPFVTAAADYLKSHRLYSGVRMPDASYLLTTMDGGVVVMGPQGELRRILNRAAGLPDNSVWAAAVDDNRDLWLGLNRGLSRIEINSSISYFTEASGIDGTVEALTRHAGELYAATGVGLFRFEKGRFTRVPGVPGPCWSLLSFEPSSGGREKLLVGASPGVYEVDGRQARLVLDTNNAFALYRSPSHPAVVLVGEAGGLSRIRFTDGRWNDEGSLAGIQDDVRSLVEDAAGDLWLGTHYSGVIRVRVDLAERHTVQSLDHFGIEHGLPNLQSVKILTLDDQLLFGTSQGIWEFDPAAERFHLLPSFAPELLPDGLGILRLVPDAQGNLWLSRIGTHTPALASRQPDGSFTIDDRQLRRLPAASWYAVYPESDGIIWLGGTEGLYRFDSTVETHLDRAFQTLIRSVTKSDGSLLFHGAPTTDPLAAAAAAEAPLPYAENSLVFLFSATSYSEPGKTRYRHILEGYDDDWSTPAPDRKKEYTNLPEGRYRFRVQAINLYDTAGAEATYSFRILPPWYRTLGFRTTALLAIAGLLWGVSRALITRTRRIQKEISEREQAAERERLIRQLEAQNAELERFTYTVSHDLKAPLVTIRGFLGFISKDAAAGDLDRLEQDLGRIEGAAAKMSELLEDLLQLSRIGRKVNPPQKASMNQLIAEALELISGRSSQRGVEVEVAPNLPEIYGDRARILEMLQNLLDNAVKYLGDTASPRVEVGVSTPPDGEPVFFVRDNGIGIESAYLEKIFGLFERLDAETEGTGIGLALVRRIVEIHGGRIWVESEGRGKGSTFFFTLPGLPAAGDSADPDPPRDRI